ncbi:DUF554 domain-containing protein [Desulfospira joergensenii]|uniref:DUF554 domain-containing protein n=1 Tax=Desulfospira joergensenii TaxID=53329 RepID=UPI0003B69823|nr:DUF554 domain-containing protein [Desulfospira joergensenii]
MLGTFVNCLAIIAGSLVGLLFKNGIPERYNQTILQAIGLCVILVGLRMALGCQDLIIVIISMALGSVIGELIGIEDLLERLGKLLEKKFSGQGPGFSTGFVTASLLFCVGSMAIVGSLESGLLGKHDTLFAKSCLDGITGMVLTSSLGVGVMFSAGPVLIYQGAITLAAGVLKPLLVPAVISQMSGVGGLLIMGLGVNMLLKQRIKVGNMLPAVFIPLVYYFIRSMI